MDSNEIEEEKQFLAQFKSFSITPRKEQEEQEEEEFKWEKLHDWASKFRADNHLTCHQFLSLINLPPNPSFLQLLSKGGKDRKVSKKEGTVGQKLREALKAAKLNLKAEDASRSPPISLNYQIQEIILEHGPELKEQGITEVRIGEDPSGLPKIRVFHKTPLTEQEIIDIFKKLNENQHGKSENKKFEDLVVELQQETSSEDKLFGIRVC